MQIDDARLCQEHEGLIKFAYLMLITKMTSGNSVIKKEYFAKK